MHIPDHILIVDDSPTQLEQMRLLLEAEGFEVALAMSGDQALQIAAEKSPSIVITDMQMPGMSGLELVEKLKEVTPLVPVVLTTSEGSEDIAVLALQKGAASYVPKRDLGSMLSETVRRVIDVVQIERQKQTISKYITSGILEMVLENDEKLVPSIIARIELSLTEVGFLDESSQMQIAMALDESLLNAMIHGNLEVDSCLRQEDDGKTYFKTIAQRRALDPYKDRRVHLRLEFTADEAIFTIRDEGPGFDANCLADPTAPENLEKPGGRGMLLINAFMDEVKHNESGNEIIMIKRKASGG